MSAFNLPDAIRIVPLATTQRLLQPPPGLSYRGGPLIPNVSIHVLYWGNYWSTASSPSTTDIDNFFSYIVTSPYITQLAEYSVPAHPIGLGNFSMSSILNVTLGSVITDAQIRSVLQVQVGTLEDTMHPPPIVNKLYFCFFPPNVQVNMGGNMSCTSFCGYHDDISGAIYYAVVPYPNCIGCGSGSTVFECMTMAASHELAEAITDPVPGAGWYDDQNGEIGDFCNAQPKILGAYTVQKIWSRGNHQCL